ncbi:response regulator transcription factor [Pseudomonas sp. BN417]|nr:response regulator transcription factor [Pseudomonas sp. BN417]
MAVSPAWVSQVLRVPSALFSRCGIWKRHVYTNCSIAELLGIQRGTVKVHRKNLYDKLEIGSQAELLAVFIRELKGG